MVTSRFEPVSSLVTVTVAPGTTAPVASFTVPVIWPVADWAMPLAARLSRASASAALNNATFLIVDAPA